MDLHYYVLTTGYYRAFNRGTNLDLQKPVNSALESGSWAQSIIWDRHTPFLDFTQLQLEDEEELIDPSALAAAEASRKEKEGLWEPQ